MPKCHMGKTLKFFVALFLSIFLNLHGAESEPAIDNPIKGFDLFMIDLETRINHYEKQLGGSQGCRIWRVGHAIFKTGLRKWYKIREKEIEEVNAFIESPTLTTRNKMAAIASKIEAMEQNWRDFERLQHDKPWLACGQVHDEEKAEFFDGFADYFHEHCRELFSRIENFLDQHTESFPEIVCVICLERQPEILYSCGHFIACKKCNEDLTVCPVCRISNPNPKKPTYFSRCKGCHQEKVAILCINCNTMELCEECSQKEAQSKYVFSCSTLLCKLKARKLMKCFPT